VRWLVAIALLTFSTPVRAEPWYRGHDGTRRVIRLSAIVGAGGLYLASETVLKPSLAADPCRWCSVDSLDKSVRDSLVWGDRQRAQTLSNITGYAAAPIAMLVLPALASSGVDDRTARIIDDSIPILESIAYSQLLVQVIKFSAGRQRPEVHFNTDPNRKATTDDNASFVSGHSALTFALATSAGVLAHRRGYGLEPVIWATGMTLAASTAYLRIAGDKHYLTDVTTGGALGVLAGIAIPRLTGSLPDDVAVVPSGNGVAVVGVF
jgi:membrane-associated phospholipid phosphatase